MYSMRLTPEQKARAITVAHKGTAAMRLAAEAVFTADSFPRMYAGKILPDLTQPEPMVISEHDLSRFYAERQRVDALVKREVLYLPTPQPGDHDFIGPSKLHTHDAKTLLTRGRSRTVYVQHRAKRWGKR